MKRTRNEDAPPKDPLLSSQKTIRFVEFYAGVGGWTMALQQVVERGHSDLSGLRFECVAALDHSDLCKVVYEHNHKPVTLSNRPIQKLTVGQVEGWQADLFVMSPPCQPHSRQHTHQKRELQDKRSESFLHLCELLQSLSTVPSVILLENVVGFERSQSFSFFQKVLKDRNYRCCHFILQPSQVGLPNDRPRFYSVAVQNDYIKLEKDSWQAKYFTKPSDDISADVIIQTEIPELGVKAMNSITEKDIPKLQHFLDNSPDPRLSIPEKVHQKRAAWCLDIVTPEQRRTSCFTSGYGKFVRGTGSVLYTGEGTFELVAPEQREYDAEWDKDLDWTKARYFSGSELARLFDFSNDFAFPRTVSVGQQWKLVGNSLNVRVAARLLEFAFRVRMDALLINDNSKDL
ncbi:tRNA (cytosine38-C5)-methyltransferase [Fistulifera solaris]|uniref:tRNA (Cytosine38-C5)-methyltransferase n=1 Tax=Fistulifera solaris TaxID=1519565 RepID=A0A1Z5JSH6_FISSO|nr:tRNA (cytosine38-C5)-methyltransferase [Fistulifera solaris]|eukprot:GAX16899.1 tRNA (cytosine38-C5)-methyltransferase [Fistulifera solaris]